MNSEKGFSLVELLAAVVIVGLLAAIALPMYSDYRQRANYAVVVSDCRYVYNAFMIYYQDNSAYPDTATFDLNNFDPLRSEGHYIGNIELSLFNNRADAYDSPNPNQFWLLVTQRDDILNQFLITDSDQTPQAPGKAMKGIYRIRNGTLLGSL